MQYNTWGYKSWEPWKSPEGLIRDMIDAAARSMNFCLNIGPMADGTFPPEAIHILNEFGKWLKINGEAVYGTEGNVMDLRVNADSRVTRQDTAAYYVHVIDWKDSPLIITTPISIIKVTPLDSSCHAVGIQISRNNGITTITVDRPTRFDPVATVLKLEKCR